MSYRLIWAGFRDRSVWGRVLFREKIVGAFLFDQQRVDDEGCGSVFAAARFPAEAITEAEA